jgi:hypothetical protein
MSVLAFAFKTYASTIPVEVLYYHSEINGNECDMSLNQEADVYSLDKATLVLIPCNRGAYQTGYVAYALSADKYVSQIMVLSWVGFVTSTNLLSEASYDPKTGLLYTFAKARGIGDCGQTSTNKVMVDEYGYISVKTTEITSQECLDEITEDAAMGNWPTVFTQ